MAKIGDWAEVMSLAGVGLTDPPDLDPRWSRSAPWAARAKRARQRKGWTLRELARRAGIDHTYLSKIENGKTPDPSQKTRAAILTALGKGCGHRCEVHR